MFIFSICGLHHTRCDSSMHSLEYVVSLKENQKEEANVHTAFSDLGRVHHPHIVSILWVVWRLWV